MGEGGLLRAPYPPGWGCTPDPAYLQWHRVPNRLTSQYTKLKTNQGIILVNISILEVTDTSLLFFVSPTKFNISKIVIFAQHKLYQYSLRIYSLHHKKKNIKNLFGLGLDFTTKNWVSAISLKIHIFAQHTP